MKRMTIWTRIQALSAHPYYTYLVALLAGLDLFLWFVPNDVLFIAAVSANSRRWLWITTIVTCGSCLGGIALYSAASLNPGIIPEWFPELAASPAWLKTTAIFQDYGYLATFIGSIGPIPMQPFLIIAAFANANPLPVLLGMALGRWAKFFTLAVLTRHSKAQLKKFTKTS